MIMLRNMKGIDYLFDVALPRYEAATGMRVNASKTEGLLLGALRKSMRPSRGVQWCKEGEWLISLGVPLGNQFNELEFWTQKCHKCKASLMVPIDNPNPLYKCTNCGDQTNILAALVNLQVSIIIETSFSYF